MAATKTEEKATDKAENKNITVTFTKPWGRYSRGDVAGFPQDQATKLTDGIKVAVAGAVSDEKSEEKVAD
jgi:hypothetical protein